MWRRPKLFAASGRQTSDHGADETGESLQPIPKAVGIEVQFDATMAALEDKIVQAAVVAILTPIYEAEFLGFSYGFRPGRSQHDALDALAYGINARKIIESRMANKVHRAPGGRSKTHPPDPEMAEGGCAGRRPAD